MSALPDGLGVPEVRGRPGPPGWIGLERAWRVTRFAEVGAVLRRPGLAVVDMHAGVAALGAAAGRDFGSLGTLLGATLLYRNPPFHARARGFLIAALSEMRPALTRAALRAHAGAIVEEAVAAGRVEAMERLAARLPLRAMAGALGLPAASAGAIAAAGARILGAWRPGLPLRVLDGMEREAARIEAMVAADLARARAEGGGGLARLAALGAERFGLGDREVAGLVFFLVWAGVETTSSLIGSALLMILSRPPVLERVRGEPGALAAALEETLRLAGPVRRVNARVAEEPVEIGGRALPAGARLACDLELAHRDPEAFPDPGRFDLDRAGPACLGFGLGEHACLGAALAKLEAQVLIEALLGRAEARVLAEAPPRWQTDPALRRLERLDLLLVPLPRPKDPA